MKAYTRSWFALVVLAITALSVIALWPRPARAAGPWYVAPGGSDGNNCTSALTPCATINGAIGKASSGDTIYVATGTYTASTGSEVVLINKNITLSGGWNSGFTTQSGMATIDGEGAWRGITLIGGVTSVIERVVVQNGYSSFLGGGVSNSGALTLTNSLVSNNTAGDPCCGGGGGGIENDNGTLVISNSTISNNRILGGLAGSAIYNSAGTLILDNSTISGNSGAVSVYNYLGAVSLNSSTISNNSSGIGNRDSSLTLRNSIVAGNNDADCVNDTGYTSTVTSLGYNLISNTSGCTFTPGVGDLVNVNAKLGPLVGFPGHHPLLPGSPAIDAGNPGGCVGSGGLLTTDQRGLPRFGLCDIGAYELQPLGFSNKTVNPSTVSPGSLLTYTIALTNGGGANFTNVMVTDTLPITLTFMSNSLTATSGSYGFNNGVITWTGAVNAGGMVTVTFGATVNQTAPLNTTIPNSAIISGGGDIFTRTALVNILPALETSTKTVDVSVASRGTPVTYTIHLRNTIGTDVPNIFITDTLPLALTYNPNSLNAPSGTFGYATGVITWTGSVNAGGVVTVTFGATVNQTALLGSSIVNPAIIGGGGEIITRTATVNVPLAQVFLPLVTRDYCPPFSDNFSNPASGWPVGDHGQFRWEYLSGEYSILVRPTDSWAGARPGVKCSDYVVAVDVRNAAGADGTYGLIFGLSDDWQQFYTFEIGPDGIYYLWRYDNGNWTLLQYGYSPSINTGTGTNRVKIERTGAQIKAYANNQLLINTSDSAYTGARHLGLIVTSYSQPNVDARFDNFVVCAPGCSGAASLSGAGLISKETINPTAQSSAEAVSSGASESKAIESPAPAPHPEAVPAERDVWRPNEAEPN